MTLRKFIFPLCFFTFIHLALGEEKKTIYVNWLRPPFFEFPLPYQPDGSINFPFSSLINAFNEVKRRRHLAPGETKTEFIYLSKGPHIIKPSETFPYTPYFSGLKDWDGKTLKKKNTYTRNIIGT